MLLEGIFGGRHTRLLAAPGNKKGKACGGPPASPPYAPPPPPTRLLPHLPVVPMLTPLHLHHPRFTERFTQSLSRPLFPARLPRPPRGLHGEERRERDKEDKTRDFFLTREPRERISRAQLDAKLSVASSLGKIDLSDCGLTRFPSDLLDMPHLEEISLAGNEITELPPELVRLTHLRKLGLAGNLLSTLPPSIEKCVRLEGNGNAHLLHPLNPHPR